MAHLHFTVFVDGQVAEPFAGPCRAGASLWAAQPEVSSELYVRGFTISPSGFAGAAELPWDRAVRTGTFVRGTRTVWFRVELGNVSDAGPVRVRFERPDGSTALDEALAAPRLWRQTWGSWRRRLALEATGTWRLQLQWGERRIVDAPFDVVASARQIRNRPPLPVAASLETTASGAVVCRVATDLALRDPDYDVVRYRYRWTVAGRVVRSVTSAATADVIPALAGPASCAVTPSDGRLAGPETTAR